MRFASTVRLFCINNIPMIGNSANGCTIGLTKEAFAICQELQDSIQADKSIKSFDGRLFETMSRNLFFDTSKPIETIRSAYLHITERCQLNCQGCYARAEGRTLFGDPTLSDLFNALMFLKKNNVNNLIIAGGEPLIRDDFDEFLHLVERCSFEKVVLLTNGLLLEKWINDLAGIVDVVSISVDTCNSDSISFARNYNCADDLDNAIELLKSKDIVAQLLVTIHAKNVCDIANYVTYGADKKILVGYSLLSKTPGLCNQGELFLSSADFSFLANWLCENEYLNIQDVPLSINLSTRDNCGAGRTTVSVAANGNVYPCHMLHNTSYIIGNVFQNPNLMIGKGGKCADLINFHGDSVTECADCDCLPLCGGGCRARALAESDSIYAPDPFCKLIKDYYCQLFSSIKAKLNY